MTEQGANNAILVSTAVTLASTTGSSLTGTDKLPASKTIVGGLLSMMGCAILAEINADLGGYLAIAIGGTAFFTLGLPTLEHYFGESQKGKVKRNG